MTRATLLLVSLTILWVNRIQAQPPPPAPVPVTPPVASTPPVATTPPIPVPVVPAPAPAAGSPIVVVPPPPPPQPLWVPSDPSGPPPGIPLFRGEPLAPRPLTLDDPGFYVGLEIDLVAPDIQRRLNSVVTVNGIPSVVNLQNPKPNWTGPYRVEIGYHLAENCGAVSVTYRSIVSSGSENIFGFDPLGDGFLHTRLNANIVDLDYISPRLAVAPLWEVDWRAGVRIAAIYYDSRATGMILGERTSNNFIGAGPHFGAEALRALPLPGLSVLGSLDLGFVIGGVNQNYEQTFLLADGTSTGGALHASGSSTAPVLTFRLGLGYTPPVGVLRWSRFSFGYQFEQWWNVGRSQGDLNVQGLFFRGEFKF
jgi:hypothetical protein